MKVCITGADGQLGQALANNYAAQHELTLLNRQALDISDAALCKKMIDTHKPNIIINAAAYNAVDKAEEEQTLAMAINAKGPGHLAELCAEQDIRFIHISTDFVFSGHSHRPYQTDDKTAPVNTYGKSKLLGEQAVLKASKQHVVIRTSWLYGNHANSFVNKALDWLKAGKHLRFVCDQISTPTEVNTLSKAIERCIDHDHLSGIFHISDAGVASRYDFVCAIRDIALRLKLIDQASIVTPINASDFRLPAARPYYSVLDKHSTWAALNIEAEHWYSTLENMLSHFKKTTS